MSEIAFWGNSPALLISIPSPVFLGLEMILNKLLFLTYLMIKLTLLKKMKEFKSRQVREGGKGRERVSTIL
jgi:hypothetical protein